mgnify:CR=1 FL=1
MTWIESHSSLRGHWKLAILCQRLGLSRPAAIGHLHLLWWWTITYSESGDLTRFPAAVIAHAAEWEGDADEFVEALVAAGFLDRDGDRLRIHDWEDYCGRLVSERERRRRWRDRRRASVTTDQTNVAQIERSAAPHDPETCQTRDRDVSGDVTPQDTTVSVTSPARDRDVSVTSPGRDRNVSVRVRPNRTVPNRTEPNRTTPTPIPPPPVADSGGVASVEEVVDPDRIVRLWNAALADTAVPVVEQLTPKRRQRIGLMLRALERQYGPSVRSPGFWSEVFECIRGSPFLCGESDSGWVVTLDWLTEEPDRVVRIREGYYARTPRRAAETGQQNGRLPNARASSTPVTPERLAELEAAYGGGDLSPSELLRRERERIRAMRANHVGQ